MTTAGNAELVMRAYALGFAASSEGYNAEYPFDGDFEGDAKWLEGRNRALAAALEATASPVVTAPTDDWKIDKSTGTDILVYKECSVIESEQAHYLLRLIKAAEPAPATGGEA